MITLELKKEMEVMVLTDLAAICKKLAEHSVLPEELRVQARQFVEEFDFLLPFSGKSTAFQYSSGEVLLVNIARFLPTIIEVDAPL